MGTELQATNSNKKICLIEPSLNLNNLYASVLSDNGYQIDTAQNGKEALDLLDKSPYDMVVMEYNLPDISGIDILGTLRQEHCDIPVIVISGQGSINTAVDVMRKGARDFLIKPFQAERLAHAVEKELELQNRKRPIQSMSHALAGLQPEEPEHTNLVPLKPKKETQDGQFGNFIGTSPVMLDVYEKIEKAAQSDASVFITGSSGTGKEVCAEAIHMRSHRKDCPFIPVNCAAIPRDLIESELFGHVKGAFTGAVSDREGAANMADGGTLFLDEIAEMKPDMQTKLLRFIQTLCFQKIGSNKIEKADIRIICATNRDPLHEIERGHFREDLYYRLNVIPIHMPPLSQRGHDILDIAKAKLVYYSTLENKHFVDINEEAARLLCQYHWPGNIRQLENVIRHSVIMHDGPLLTAAMLPAVMFHRKENATVHHHAGPMLTKHAETIPGQTEPSTESLAEIEKKVIMNAITECNGNIPQAAAKLKISPSTIYRKKAEWKKTG